MPTISYQKRRNWKYGLYEDYTVQTEYRPDKEIVTSYCRLTTTGLLAIFKGYTWDGASGPTFDTKSSMRASLVHDCLYQLIREGFLVGEYVRLIADNLFYKILLQDNMWAWRAKWWYRIVRKAAAGAAEYDVIVAP